jgi:leucyl aminopeptidase
MQFSTTASSPPGQRSDCLVLGVFSARSLSDEADAVDRVSRGQLAQWIKHSALDGSAGQSPLTLVGVRGLKANRVVLVGLGARSRLDAAGFLKALRKAADAVLGSGAASAAFYLDSVDVDGRDSYWKLRQSVEVVSAAAYRFDECKSKPKRSTVPKLKRVHLAAPHDVTSARARDALSHGRAIAAGVAAARTLGNLPGNICTPGYLARYARQLARSHSKLSVRVVERADMKRLGMRSLLSVAGGSREAPKLIVMRYAGAASGQKPIALVGKGVTFDSGGISLKPAAAMDEMKFDMCGAASVLGTMETAARLGLALNLVALIPATENLPGGNASKPGDIVTTLSGQTVEILNTDAEGRLILCDTLTYAERFKPDVVIDVATLTGACVVALGAQASGLWSNDETLAQELTQCGTYAADRVWQMPLWPEYEESLRSNFADVANVGGRDGGAITAAVFLSRFAGDFRWAHLDIAGTAWKQGKAKGATGRPVALLSQFLLDRAGAGA